MNRYWRWPSWSNTWWSQPWGSNWSSNDPWNHRHVTWADGYPQSREAGVVPNPTAGLVPDPEAGVVPNLEPGIIPDEVAREVASAAAEATNLIMSTALSKSPAPKRRLSRGSTATSTASVGVDQPENNRQEDQWDGNLLELGETGKDNRGAQYRRLNLVVDSGAFKSVIPPEVGTDYPTEEVSASERPRARTATGEEVSVLGKKTLTCHLNNGSTKTLSFLVMDVMRPLASVSQMISRDCRVVFDGKDGEGSYIYHKPTSDTHKLFLRRGVFILPVWIVDNPCRPEKSGK